MQLIRLNNEINLEALTDVSALCFKASESDLKPVISMDKENMKYSWTSATWNESLMDASLLLAFDQDLGFVLFQKNLGDSVLHLLKIVVIKKARSTGESTKLLQKSLLISRALHSDIESVYLEVEEENPVAVGFYLKNDFKAIHKKKGYYSDGATALFMQKIL